MASSAPVSPSDTLTLEGIELQLNGYGVRKKKLLGELCIVSLYVTAGVSKPIDPGSIINSTAPVAIHLDIISALVSAGLFTKMVDKAFRKSTGGNFAPLKDRLDAFKAALCASGFSKGDKFTLLFLPSNGLHIFKGDDKKLGVVEGDDFSKALISIWLGDQPVDENLKKALLAN